MRQLVNYTDFQTSESHTPIGIWIEIALIVSRTGYQDTVGGTADDGTVTALCPGFGIAVGARFAEENKTPLTGDYCTVDRCSAHAP